MAHITDQELGEAEERMRERLESGPYAVKAHFNRARHKLIIILNSGMELAISPKIAEGISEASPDQLDQIELSPTGLGLYFPKLDADLYVPSLLTGVTGSRSWMAKLLGAKGGAVKTPAKAAAARANGRLGGRPRMTIPIQKTTTKDKVAREPFITKRTDEDDRLVASKPVIKKPSKPSSKDRVGP